MFRYMTFCWNRRNEAEAQSALRLAARLEATTSDWRVKFRGPGIRVYTADERAGASGSVPLQNGFGVVVGTLFERTDDTDQRVCALRDIGANESTCIARTDGRRLIDKYWGRYVAFVRNPETGHIHVIRDPTGALPCLCLKIDGVQIFAADIEDCCDLTTSTFSINWPYVQARALIPGIQTAATGLNSVSQLLPGHCINFRDGKSEESVYWHLCHVAESGAVEDEAEVADRFRNAVTQAVHSWAGCHEGIVLKLSGGLDSAIVLGCLSTMVERPSVICANDYSQGADTDERYYARLSAERAGCALVERARGVTGGLERSLAFRRMSTPFPSHSWVQTHPTNEELATRNSATALFTGNGGDQLFLTGEGHWPVADYLYYRGLRPRAIRMAHDAAYLEPPARCKSWWSLLRKGIRLGVLSERSHDPFSGTPDCSGYTMFTRDVTQTVASEYRSWLPPWCHGTYNLPPGKIAQVHRLSSPNSFYPVLRSQPGTLEPVHPLLSQPVIEASLRARTYALMSGTNDRTAARKAFEHVLPSQIVKRRGKGGVDNHAVHLLLGNVHFVREFLLGGELVRHQILDRSAVEDIFGGNREGLEFGTYMLINVLQVEAWLRAWTDPRKNVESTASAVDLPTSKTQPIARSEEAIAHAH